MAGDERVDHVVPRELGRDEAHEADDCERHPDAADGTPAIARQPHGQAEGREGQQREQPRERLQELEEVLDGPELVRAEDHDLARVVRKVVGDLRADAEAVGGLEDDRPEIEDHLAVGRRHALAAALEHLHERSVGLLDGCLEERLEARLLERAVDYLVRPLAPCGG